MLGLRHHPNLQSGAFNHSATDPPCITHCLIPASALIKPEGIPPIAMSMERINTNVPTRQAKLKLTKQSETHNPFVLMMGFVEPGKRSARIKHYASSFLKAGSKRRFTNFLISSPSLDLGLISYFGIALSFMYSRRSVPIS